MAAGLQGYLSQQPFITLARTELQRQPGGCKCRWSPVILHGNSNGKGGTAGHQMPECNVARCSRTVQPNRDFGLGLMHSHRALLRDLDRAKNEPLGQLTSLRDAQHACDPLRWNSSSMKFAILRNTGRRPTSLSAVSSACTTWGNWRAQCSV